MLSVKCLSCGKEFRTYPSNLARGCGKFCSKACHYKFHRGVNAPIPYSRVTKVCEVCGHEFTVKRSKNDTARFCSLRCMIQWRSSILRGENNPRYSPKTIRHCLQCGKSIEVSVNQAPRKVFCSRQCHGRWRNLHMKTKATKPELILAELLEKANIAHVSQKTIGNFKVDEFVPPGLIVEVDGEYWHNRNLTTIMEDKARQQYLEALNFKVLRFWAREILIKPAYCLKRIRYFLRS